MDDNKLDTSGIKIINDGKTAVYNGIFDSSTGNIEFGIADVIFF
jgi:hypothetical protein